MRPFFTCQDVYISLFCANTSLSRCICAAPLTLSKVNTATGSLGATFQAVFTQREAKQNRLNFTSQGFWSSHLSWRQLLSCLIGQQKKEPFHGVHIISETPFNLPRGVCMLVLFIVAYLQDKLAAIHIFVVGVVLLSNKDDKQANKIAS